jgi:hypothetical protein
MARDVEASSLVLSLQVEEVKTLLGVPETEDVQSDGSGVLQYELPGSYYLQIEIVGGRAYAASVLDW